MTEQIDTDGDRPTARRRHASVPVLVGSLIAAGGLIFGGVATANAYNHGTPAPATSRQADRSGKGGFLRGTHPHPSLKRVAHPPKNGNKIPNVSLVENEIKNYYGSVTGTVGDDNRAVTLPSPTGLYAKQMRRIEAHAKRYFAKQIKRYEAKSHKAAAALVFDVDDTTLNTYDYEIFSNFAYNPATNADFVNHADFPAVFGMPHFVNWAKKEGYTIFFLTGRPETQREGTVKNLKMVGYHVPLNTKHLYLKYPSLDQKPGYVHCTGPKDPSTGKKTCTTIDYKSGTRRHIEKQGYRILGDFGDQFSDLKGGAAGTEVKLPNPMYYLP